MGFSMNKYLQILTNIAVLAGIILLIFELNQASNLTRAQLYDGAYDAAVTRNLTLVGESPAEILAKAMYAPETLNETDAVTLNQFYNSLLTSWYRNKDERGIGYFGSYYAFVVKAEAYLLNTIPGRAWWDSVRNLNEPAIRDIVDEYLANNTIAQARKSTDAILNAGKVATP